ncbi:MAG TPA: hypothetical protein VL463_06950 [Kofleriaceae bacterium]|jgi:hypothetical protein|nr:hypothetical protein [Kofleriaceae bacterium]
MNRALLSLLVLAACVDHQPDLWKGTTSLEVQLIAPADPGSQTNRLPPNTTNATIKVTAKDDQGAIDTTVNRDVDLYIQFLGTFTPDHVKAVPFQKITLTNGVSQPVTIDLPPTFGPTVLWVEDVEGADPSYSTGTSPQLWFRDPFIVDIQKPVDETAVNALEDSPLENKNVVVTASRYGAMGRLVVSGVYAQGYTLDDVKCADANGTPPCVAGDYDHAFIYSFSRASDQMGRVIRLGENVVGFQGAVSEFNGLTEVGFPQSFVDDTTPHENQITAPVKVDNTWFTNKIMFERNEAGLVEVDGATLCPLDADYTTYQQWKLDLGSGCKTAINVITAGVVNFDPTTYVGKVIPKVIGTMRPINIGSFNVWILYPRFDQDLVLQ